MRQKQVGNGKEIVSLEELARLQSVVATHEKPWGLTSKYRFYSTMEIVEALSNEGWMPVIAQEQWCRNMSGQGYQKHMIRLRQMQSGTMDLNDILPEIVLTNAHNGLARYKLLAALMRLACLNGLVVSAAQFAAITFVHKGFSIEDVIGASKKIFAGFGAIAAHVGEYKQITLSNAERFEFARQALSIRFGVPAIEDKGLIKLDNRIFSPDELLEPVRDEDVPPSLWNTFNVVQEKVVKGAKFERTMYISESMTEGISRTRTISRSKVKGIESIDTNLSFNRGLWALLETTYINKLAERPILPVTLIE